METGSIISIGNDEIPYYVQFDKGYAAYCANHEIELIDEPSTTLRDQFAMSALTGILAGGWNIHEYSATVHAYLFADAMLEQRKDKT
jgi:hypothetical protein